MEPQSSASVRTTLTLFLFLSLFVFAAVRVDAGGRRHAVAVSRAVPELTLTFVHGPVLDTGRVAWRGGRRRSTVTTHTVVLRIGAASREVRGTATLRAFLETPESATALRVNGVLLGAAPRIVRRHVPIGAETTLRIEIEVPVSAPEGPLAASIGWEVTTD